MAKRAECQICGKTRSTRNIYKGICKQCRAKQGKYCTVCGSKDYFKTYKGHDLCRKHYNQLSWIPNPSHIIHNLKTK